MAPFIMLRRKAEKVEEEDGFLGSSLADRTTPFALVSAIRYRSLVAVLTTAASLSAAFLTVFSATLFAPASIPTSVSVSTQQEEWFAPLAATMLDPMELFVSVVVDEATRQFTPLGRMRNWCFQLSAFSIHRRKPRSART